MRPTAEANPSHGHAGGIYAPHARELLGAAALGIDQGLTDDAPPEIEPADYPELLQAPGAAFVTLLDGAGHLRGCIGSIEAHRPLVVDVAANAFAAAFQDPRFPPLTAAERPDVQCRLSVLTPPERMGFDDETDLIRRLRPGEDGLLIECGSHRGTLLPAVWEDIPDPVDFWITLKRKAGLADEAFPAGLAVYRYTTESFG